MKSISEQEQWRLLALSSIKSKKQSMPFKVTCIAKVKPRKSTQPLSSYPQIGSEYTVVRQIAGDMHLYSLAEYPTKDHLEHWFDARAFATTKGPCEIAIAEERLAADQAEELDKEWARIVHEEENA